MKRGSRPEDLAPNEPGNLPFFDISIRVYRPSFLRSNCMVDESADWYVSQKDARQRNMMATVAAYPSS